MSLELSAIKFDADTTKFAEAENRINNLISKVQELANASKGLTSENTAAALAQAKLNLLNEKTALDAARRVHVELKTSEAIKRSTSAQRELGESLGGAERMLEKQTTAMRFLRGEMVDVAEGAVYLKDGFTKSQATQLATMKMIGGTAEQLQILARSFEEYNLITGVNTFDKSASGISKMKKELDELNQVSVLTNQGLALTRDELVNYSRDLQRLQQQYKSEGRSTEELVQAQKDLKASYISTSAALNTRRAESKLAEEAANKAARAEIQAAKDVANANSFITSQLEKLNYQLNNTNENLSKGSANALMRFEMQLKKSGLTLDEQTSKLNEYRMGLERLARLQRSTEADHISRALGPQITDITVGLATGQGLMTVLLQQGGQLRDQMGMFGVKAKEMGPLMQKSMSEMKDSILNTGKAVGFMFAGMVRDMGNWSTTAMGNASIGIVAAAKSMLQGKEAAKEFKDSLMDSETGINKFTFALTKIPGLSMVVGAGILAVIGSLVALGKAFYDVIKLEEDLSKSLVMNSASLSLNIDSAKALAIAYEKTGVAASDTLEILSLMAKEGGFRPESIKSVVQATEAMRKIGISTEETVKAFAKVNKDPVQALIELGTQTGKVNVKVIELVANAMRNGEVYKATALATDEYARATKSAAEDIDKMSGKLTKLGRALAESGHGLYSFFKSFFVDAPVLEELAKREKELSDIQARNAKRGRNTETTEWYETEIKRLKEIKELTEKNNNAASQAAAMKGLTESLNNQAFAANVSAKNMTRGEFILAKYAESARNAKVDFAAWDASLGKIERANYDKMFGKIWEEAQDKTAYSAGSDRFAKLQTSLNKELEAVQKRFKVEQDLLSNSRKYGLITEQTYRDALTSKMDSSHQEQLQSIRKFVQDSNAEEARAIGAAGTGFAVSSKSKSDVEKYNEDIRAIKEKARANREAAVAQKEALQVEAFKHYGDSLYEAIAQVMQFKDTINALSKEEAKLLAQRERSVARDTDMLFASPEKIAYLQGYYAELDRLEQKNIDVSDKANKAAVAFQAQEQALIRASTSPAAKAEDIKVLQDALDEASIDLMFAQAALKEFNAEMQVGAKNQGAAAELKYYQDILKSTVADFNALSTGDRIAEGFDKGSEAVGGMVSAVLQLTKAQEALNYAMQNGTEEQKKWAKDNQAIIEIQNYKKLTQSAKKYFGEKTAMGKAASVAEKAFQAIELATAVQTFAVKMAGYADVAGAAIISAGTQIAALFGVGQALSVNAVLTQGQGDPYSAPVRMAAMAATVAALGFAVGGLGGSGSKAAPMNTGTGTVLGDSSAQSESIARSIEKLKDVNNLGLRYSSAMLVSLNNIDNNTRRMLGGVAQSEGYANQANNLQLGSKGITNNFSARTAFGAGVGALAGAGVGAAVGSFLTGLGSVVAGPLGAVIGTAVGAILAKPISKLFGSSRKMTGQGISASDQSISDILSGGFQGQYFTDVQIKEKVAGFTTSKRNRTYLTEADQVVEDEITKIFMNFADVIKAAAKPLGFSLDEVDSKLSSFVVKIGRIDLKGLSPEDQQKRLSAVFSAEGDRLAQSVMQSLEPFQQAGEGFLQTVVRVASGVEEGSMYLNKLNIAIKDYNTLLDKQSDVAFALVKESILATEGVSRLADILNVVSGSAEDLANTYSVLNDLRTSFIALGMSGNAVSLDLLKGSGGFQALQDNWGSFQDSFLSDSEKITVQSAIMQKEFAKLGLTLPATADDFKNLVLQAKNLGTASGDELLGRLLALSDGFSKLTDSASAYNSKISDEAYGLETQKLQLLGKTTELRARELAKLDASNRALQEEIWLLEDQKTATDALVSALKDAGKTIAAEIKRLNGSSNSTGSSIALQAQFAMQTAQARSGNLDALKGLPELSKAIETSAIASSSTEVELARIRGYLASSLSATLSSQGLGLDALGNITTDGVTSTSTGTSTSPLVINNTNQDLLNELKTLNSKVADLEAAAVATALSNSKVQKILERVTPDGNNLSVVVNTETAPVQVQTV